MERLIRKIITNKNNKRSINGYSKCFIANDKAKELFKNSRTFSDIKNHMNKKKYLN